MQNTKKGNAAAMAKLFTNFLRILSRNIPSDHTQEVKWVKTLIVSVILTVFFAGTLIFIKLLHGAAEEILFLLPHILASFLAILVTYRQGRPSYGQIIFLLGIFTTMTSGIIYYQGVLSPPGLGAIIVPLIAYMVGGSRIGAFFCLMAVSSFLANFLYFGMGENVMTSPAMQAELPVVLLFSMVSMSLIGYFYQSSQEKTITLLSEAKKKAHWALESKSLYIAKLTHDMRTPMNVILGFSEMIREDSKSPVILRYLKKIEYSAEFILELINNIVDLARIEAGKFAIRKNPCKIKDFFSELVSLSEGILGKNRNQLTTDHSFAHQVILTDSLRLRQILLNLIGNATKYTHEGTIHIKACIVSSHLKIMINDSGSGIPQKELQRIREDFSQVNNEVNHSTTGSGLGLSIVSELVKLLNGTIEFSSTDAGTSVFLEFPVEQLTEQDDKEYTGHDNVSSPVVLVVDDDPDIRDTFKEIIEEFGSSVVVAENGLLGLHLFNEIHPKIVIADMYMPKMSGLQMSVKMRQLNKKTHIILVSGEIPPNGLMEKIGVNKFYNKPLEDVFFADIEKILKEEA